MRAQFSLIKATSPVEKVIIYDIAVNHYGNRMAVCSSDQLVTVWNKVNEWKEWKKTAEWKAHRNPTLKISWVHPEFGQALATCSVDRSVTIWEEMLDFDSKIEQDWVRKASLMESTTFITDFKFAPKSVGLYLAVCSSNSYVRIFKSLDVTDLSQWSLLQEVCYRYQLRCISWNPNATCDNFSFKYFKIDNNESDERNRDFGSIYSLNPRVVDEPNSCIVLSKEPMLAVGFDDEDCKTEGKIKILLYASRYQRWTKTEFSVRDKYRSEITDPIYDLSFAARLGRTYDLLAVAAKDIKIYALYQFFNQSHSSFKFQFCLIHSFSCHTFAIRRINWNPVGNILISSGDDGCVRQWKQYQVLNDITEKNTFTQKSKLQRRHMQYCWKCVSVLKISHLQS